VAVAFGSRVLFVLRAAGTLDSPAWRRTLRPAAATEYQEALAWFFARSPDLSTRFENENEEPRN